MPPRLGLPYSNRSTKGKYARNCVLTALLAGLFTISAATASDTYYQLRWEDGGESAAKDATGRVAARALPFVYGSYTPDLWQVPIVLKSITLRATGSVDEPVDIESVQIGTRDRMLSEPYTFDENDGTIWCGMRRCFPVPWKP